MVRYPLIAKDYQRPSRKSRAWWQNRVVIDSDVTLDLAGRRAQWGRFGCVPGVRALQMV